MVAAVIMLYAVPATVARRKAVVTSREGDRFSPGMDLVTAQKVTVDPVAQQESTRPLLPTVLAAQSEGTSMTDVSGAPRSGALTAGPSAGRGRQRFSPTQQMTALRARRVARLSREAAAVKQRIAAAAGGSILMLAFAIPAALGRMSWAWISLPALVLVATVASSMWGSWKAQQDSAAEIAELARIKESMRSEGAVPRHPRVISAQNRPHAASAPRPAASQRPRHDVSTPLPAELDSAGETRGTTRASDPRGREDATHRPTAEAIPGEEERPQSEEIAENKAPSRPEPALRSRQWDVAVIPPVRGAGESLISRRRVHADTDLVPKVERREEGVPVRPLRKSDAVAQASQTAAQLTGPTFRFDLDAVLDQRRAQ